MAPLGAATLSPFPVMTPALWAMCPRTLLLVSLLTLVHGAPAKRHFDPDEIYYMNGNTRCLRCHPGHYVLRHCTAEDTKGTCAPCSPGYTYSEFLTGQTECLTCTVCHSDQDEVSPCTIYKDTVCKCKAGTYCPAGEYCEICHKCTARCPPGEEMRTPCNSTSDIQCGPPETDSNILAILLPILVFFIIGIAAFCIWFFYWRKNNNKSRLIPKILTVSFKCEKSSGGDAGTPFLSQVPKLRFKGNLTENQKNEAVAKTFNIFIDLVPPKVFDKFVRELGLTDNEIDRVTQDNENYYNRSYQKLLLLHQDKKFDVNICLQKLCDLKMKKVAQDIAETLTKDELFEQSS